MAGVVHTWRGCSGFVGPSDWRANRRPPAMEVWQLLQLKGDVSLDFWVIERAFGEEDFVGGGIVLLLGKESEVHSGEDVIIFGFWRWLAFDSHNK